MQLTHTKPSKFQKVSEIKIPKIFFERMKTGIEEIDCLFGEGVLPGSTFTFTGLPGIGKSVGLLQIMEALTNNGYDIGYASGEESKFQLAYTCRRLQVKNVSIANETDIDTLAKSMESLDVLVIDSFQALTSSVKMNSAELERYAVNTLISAAKKTECALFFIVHATKIGGLRGSSLVPHAVDVNFLIEKDEDGDDAARIINVYKNRYGPTGQYGATMSSHGLVLSGKKQTVAAPSKKQRAKTLHAEILKLDPPNITKPGIMKRFDLTSSQAYLALKELTDLGKILKMGRGSNAVWKKVLLSK